MKISETAEVYARERYGQVTRPDGTPHVEHARGVVTRLKGLGISDEEIIAAAWLHGILSHTSTSFDELDSRFGSRVSVLVLALFSDPKIPRDQRDRQYVRQLRESPDEAKLIKICDISTSLKELKGSSLSRTKKARQARKEMHYLAAMSREISDLSMHYPAIMNIMDGINEYASEHGQRRVLG